MIVVSHYRDPVSVSLAKRIKYNHTDSHNDCIEFYLAAMLWDFIQYHVIDRNRIGNRCDCRQWNCHGQKMPIAI